MSHSGPNWAYNYQPSPAEWEAAFEAKQDWSAILDTIIAQGGAPAQTVGTWTPNDQSGAGLTLAVSANYTRIGNLVFAYGQITYPTTADTSAAIIGGLPVPIAPEFYARGPCPVGNDGALSICGYPQSSSTQFALKTPAGVAITNAQLSGRTIDFILTYPAV
jgi:hypothetical protein